MELEAELLRLRDEVVGLKAELAEFNACRDLTESLTRDLAEARAEIGNMTAELNDLRNSWSWRLGYLLLTPMRILRFHLGGSKSRGQRG